MLLLSKQECSSWARETWKWSLDPTPTFASSFLWAWLHSAWYMWDQPFKSMLSSYWPSSPRNLPWRTELSSEWASPENNLSYEFSLRKNWIVILAALRNSVSWSVSRTETEKRHYLRAKFSLHDCPWTTQRDSLGREKCHVNKRCSVCSQGHCTVGDTILPVQPYCKVE